MLRGGAKPSEVGGGVDQSEPGRLREELGLHLSEKESQRKGFEGKVT